MKKKAFLLLMTMTLAMGVSACGSTEKETETKKDTKVTTGEVGTVSVDELDTSKMQVIDIRGEEQYIGWTTEEGKGGHIKDAIDFPESWLDMDIENDAAIGTTMESELERRGLDLSKETVL